MTFNTREYIGSPDSYGEGISCRIFPNSKTTYCLLEYASSKEDANFNAFNRIMLYKKTKDYLEKVGIAGEQLDNGDMVYFDEYGRAYRVTHAVGEDQ
jgi:hypothetical protein